jgi:TctA family transporter
MAGRIAMDFALLDNLYMGLRVALGPQNLLHCFLGVLVGTVIGVLPGIGPTATVAMLLPMTFGLSPISGLIMLAACVKVPDTNYGLIS